MSEEYGSLFAHFIFFKFYFYTIYLNYSFWLLFGYKTEIIYLQTPETLQ